MPAKKAAKATRKPAEVTPPPEPVKPRVKIKKALKDLWQGIGEAIGQAKFGS